MTQIRYFDYGTPQTGWTDAQQFLGILQPGRYKGFDAITVTNGTTISVTHSNDRALISPNIAQANSNNTGVWLTNQGVVIKEDATIAGLTNASMDNTGGANTRIFAVYGQHQYAALPGGTTATYAIKAGGTDGSYPVLDTPKTQVLLLYIHIPAGQNATGGGVYVELPRMVGLGYEQHGLIDWENVFNKTQQWKQAATLATYASGKISLNKVGNTYAVDLTGDFQFIQRTGFQPGTKIVIQNRNATIRKLFIDGGLSSGSYNSTYDSGFSQLAFTDGLADGDIRYWNMEQYDVAVFELVDSGTTRGIYWHLIWCSSLTAKLAKVINNNVFPLRVDIPAVTESEIADKELVVYNTGASFPGSAFNPADSDYTIEGRLSIRLRAFVQIEETCMPFTTTTPDLAYTPHFDVVITKNTTAAPDATLMASANWGTYVVSANICYDGGLGFSVPAPDAHFITLNGSVIVTAKASDVFRVWIISEHNLGKVETKDLANNIANELVLEPITKYLG